MLTETNNLGQVTASTYDGVGNQEAVTDALGNVTTYYYDALNRLTTVLDAAAGVTTYSYDLNGNRTAVTDARGKTTSYTYDLLNRLVTVTDPLGRVATYAYDAAGNKTQVTYDDETVVKYAYDALNRVKQIGEPAGASDGFESGNYSGGSGWTAAWARSTSYTSVVTSGSPQGSYHLRIQRTGWVTRTVDVSSMASPMLRFSVKATSWESSDQAKVDVSPNGSSWTTLTTFVNGFDGSPYASFDFDLTPYVSGSTLTIRFLGVMSATDDNWYIDDVSVTDAASGAVIITYAYDAAGNRVQMTDGMGTTAYAYNAHNSLTSVTFPGSQVVSYQYNAVGDRTRITYPDSKYVDYAYDPAHNLATVTDWLGKTTSYTYNNAGYLTLTTLPSSTGVTVERAYDDADRLTSVANKQGANTLSSFVYTLNAMGNRTSVTDLSGVTTYTYDALHRLTSAAYPGGPTDTYTYDAAGNRLTKNADTYTYDDANQLVSVGSTTFTYDARGNQLTKGTDTFAWDELNRLTSATVGGTTTANSFDGRSLRLVRTVGGVPVGYVWDVGSDIPQIVEDTAGATFVYGQSRISVTDGGGTQTYFLYDGLGSTVGLVDGVGNVLGSYAYDVFGAERSQSGATTEFSFTGEQNDANGLEYLRARFYDPASGRFLGQDSAGPSFDAPLTLNRFSYVVNNPVNLVDPSGECIFTACKDVCLVPFVCTKTGESVKAGAEAGVLTLADISMALTQGKCSASDFACLAGELGVAEADILALVGGFATHCGTTVINAAAIYLSFQFPGAAPLIGIVASQLSVVLAASTGQGEVSLGLDAANLFGSFIAIGEQATGKASASSVPLPVLLAFTAPSVGYDAVDCGMWVLN